MSWATKRRLIILTVVGVIACSLIGGIVFLSLQKPPTCVDGIQNQNEEGVDCGGSCTYLCATSVVPPVVSFAREFTYPNGRTDVIAYIQNPNSSAGARRVSYTVELYSATRTILATKSGVVDLPPALEVPVYLSNIYAGTVPPERAFLTIDASSLQWFRPSSPTLLPLIKNTQPIEGNENAPRIVATVENPYATPLRNVKLIATVFNEQGNAIAATQTIVSLVPPQGSEEAVFTWPGPFTEPVGRIDVRPSSTLETP